MLEASQTPVEVLESEKGAFSSPWTDVYLVVAFQRRVNAFLQDFLKIIEDMFPWMIKSSDK